METISDFSIEAGCEEEEKVLSEIIRGKRVLVLGSGHSAQALETIPPDVVVLSCNMGPLMLIEKGLNPHVDVYIANPAAFKNYGENIIEMLEQLQIDVFLSRDPEYIRSHGGKISYDRIFLDRVTRSAQYLIGLVSPNGPETIVVDNGGKSMFPSTGVGLIQYALHFGASEIFLSGIDLDIDEQGHVLVESTAGGYDYHKSPDQNFFSWLGENYTNVFAISASSPIVETELVPHKPLE